MKEEYIAYLASVNRRNLKEWEDTASKEELRERDFVEEEARKRNHPPSIMLSILKREGKIKHL